MLGQLIAPHTYRDRRRTSPEKSIMNNIHLNPARKRPLRNREVALTAEPPRVSEARRHVAGVMRDWGVDVDSDVAVLLTSELFTNALCHGAAPGEVIRLVATWDGESFRVEVHDCCPTQPMVRPDASESAAAESGRPKFGHACLAVPERA
jgi:hypothetical protein